MKIKTKRGARRVRNQRVIDRRFVVTDYEGCSYITAGKLYRVLDMQRGHIDRGDGFVWDVMIGAWFGHADSHLDCVGTWYHPIR